MFLSGFEYRVRLPFAALQKYDVSVTPLPELPNNPFLNNDFGEICRFVAQFDLTIIQRCYKIGIVKTVRDACDMVGRKLIFETDDDYFNLPPQNPCFPEMAAPGVLEGYKEILRMADMVTCSTQELKEVLHPYNNNIHVLPNNLEEVFCGDQGPPARGYMEEVMGPDGKVFIGQAHGLVQVPSYVKLPDQTKFKTIRIGYTGTPTHREDFATVHHALEKILDKYGTKIWLIYIGDRYFYEKTNNARGRVIHIPVSQYQLYMYHIRNIDIGIAPLVPNIFNQSKSPLKAMEYAAWGIPAVLPNFVTYNREFTHGENSLMYYNSHEFYEHLEELIHNEPLRNKLGQAARDHVAANRLERQHAKRRYDLYRTMLPDGPLKRFEVRNETAGIEHTGEEATERDSVQKDVPPASRQANLRQFSMRGFGRRPGRGFQE